MTVGAKHGGRTADSIAGLAEWLTDLPGGPLVNRVHVAECMLPVHRDGAASWWYIEADAHAGVARLRCLACGDARPVLDSAERWTFPAAWSCGTCAQSIAEVAFGMHLEDDDSVTWVAVGVRCVNCGEIGGVTDLVVGGMPLADALAAL